MRRQSRGRSLLSSPGMGVRPKLLFYRFWNFDLEEPFMPQFDHNNRALIDALQTLI